MKFSDSLEEASRFINKERDKALKRVMLADALVIDKFMEEDEYIQKEILYGILHLKIKPDNYLIWD